MISHILQFLLFLIIKFVFLSFAIVRYLLIKLTKVGFSSDNAVVFSTSINLLELNPFAKNGFIVF